MGLNQNYQLDDLDLQILDILIKDCRTPYLEIARMCHVSGGTIHVRIKKMEELSNGQQVQRNSQSRPRHGESSRIQQKKECGTRQEN